MLPHLAQFARANAVCFIDWDDTLMFTSEVTKTGSLDGLEFCGTEMAEKLVTLDRTIARSLGKFASMSNVLIVSNAEMQWITSSCDKYFPNVKRVVENYGIKVISARDEFCETYVDQPVEWKAQCFLREVKNVVDLTHEKINVVVVGDDSVDVLAAQRLENLLPEAVVKAIKFLEKPSVDELLRQISLLNIHFQRIYSHEDSLVLSMRDSIVARN